MESDYYGSPVFPDDEKEEREMTFDALSRWYVRTFEKMGWMILALHDGDLDKLSHYLKKISRLIRALDLKASKTRDVDRARDLRLMSKNAVVLFEDVSRVVQRGANVRRRH